MGVRTNARNGNRSKNQRKETEHEHGPTLGIGTGRKTNAWDRNDSKNQHQE